MTSSDLPGETRATARALLPVFVAAIFVSAALLFAVQPMFTKMVLPRLGGAAAVWSVAMVFFQTTLLAGYAYAHALTRFAPGRTSVVIHLVVMIAACFALPLHIAAGWGAPPPVGEAFWLLGLFAASIGLPFFALAANGPLLQAWFVRTDHPAVRDPYFLYAASNAGSFLALLSYPLAIEPFVTLGGQTFVVDRRLLRADPAGRRLRRADAALARSAAASRCARRGARAADLARHARMDRARRRALRPADRRHGAHLDRRRGGAAAMGRAARALSAHLRDRVPDPPADPASVRARRAAVPHPRAGGRLPHLPDHLDARADRAASRRAVRLRAGRATASSRAAALPRSTSPRSTCGSRPAACSAASRPD